MKLNIATLGLVAVAAVFFISHAWGLPWTIPRIAGAAIAVPSLLLLAVARMQLGGAFSVQAKATTLVTSGLYSRMRNPIYVFGGLTIAGVMIWLNRPWLLLWFGVLVPLQVYRSRKEERVLAETFGAAYQDYKSKTWF